MSNIWNFLCRLSCNRKHEVSVFIILIGAMIVKMILQLSRLNRHLFCILPIFRLPVRLLTTLLFHKILETEFFFINFLIMLDDFDLIYIHKYLMKLSWITHTFSSQHGHHFCAFETKWRSNFNLPRKFELELIDIEHWNYKKLSSNTSKRQKDFFNILNRE